MVKRDNIHYTFRRIDGYNKPFNFVMSAREPGKTTSAWMDKIYTPWKKNKKPWIYLVRKTVEITDALIQSIFDNNMNKFTDDNVSPEYNKGSVKDGIVDVRINGEIFFRIVSLSIDLRRIKLAILKNIGGVLCDEYIIDPKTGEKYIKEEAYKIKEAYTTWRRASEGILKCYFLGNPYSLYNPLFVDWGVDTNRLKRGQVYVGDIFAIEWALITPELREYILSVNPLYQFDEDYAGYALEGNAKNDMNIKLSTLPVNYTLQYVFKIANSFIGVYRNKYIDDMQDRYFCTRLDKLGINRDAYCFEFDELVEGCALLSNEDRQKFQRFKKSIQKNRVAFSSIDIYYLIIEIYQFL